MNPSLAVAVAQLPPTNDPAENRASIDAAVREAAAGGARLIVLPEEALLLADGLGDDLAAAVEASWPAGLELVSDLARTLDVWVIVGGYEPHGADRPYNTLVMIDDRGVQRAAYRKLHLYDAFAYKESDYVVPGDALPPIVLVDGVAVGLLNCYDLRFPELARALVAQGADVLSVSAAWVAGARKEDHWTTLLRARAIESTCWVVASGSTSPDCIGESMIVDPLGVPVATLGPAKHGVAYATVRLDETARVREILPVLANRRLEIDVRVGEVQA